MVQYLMMMIEGSSIFIISMGIKILSIGIVLNNIKINKVNNIGRIKLI